MPEQLSGGADTHPAITSLLAKGWRLQRHESFSIVAWSTAAGSQFRLP